MIEMCMKLSVVASNYNLFERREIFVLMYGLYIFGSWSLFYTQLHMCHTDFRCIIIRIKTRDRELHHNISTRDYPPIWCVDMDLIHRSGKKESFFFRGNSKLCKLHNLLVLSLMYEFLIEAINFNAVNKCSERTYPGKSY